MEKWLTFQEVETKEDAEALAAILEKNGIATKIEVSKALLDHNIIGTQYGNQAVVKVIGADFSRARQVLIENTPVNLAEVPQDYMLRGLSNEELKDILGKPDDWGAYNYNVAVAILKSRGIAIEVDEITTMQQRQLGILSQQRVLNLGNYLLGYGMSAITIVGTFLKSSVAALPLVLFYSVPAFFGIVFGLIYRLTKKTLPDGSQIYSYNDNARVQGLFMIGLNVLALCYALLSRIL